MAALTSISNAVPVVSAPAAFSVVASSKRAGAAVKKAGAPLDKLKSSSWAKAAVSGSSLGSGAKANVSRVVRCAAAESASAVSQQPVKKSRETFTCALIFDCDGVIAETEEAHRLAYNASFQDHGLTIDGTPVEWTTAYYDVLQNTVGGGKPKMRYHFNNNGWPATKAGPPPTTEEEKTALIDKLQDCKTEHYTRIMSTCEARPGVLALMDEGLARPDVAMCICSAATKAGFEQVVNSAVGKERLARFDVILAGDDVSRKKPDPLIYNTARERLGLPKDKCVVIEDSMVGLRAAVGAGMHCIITPTASTINEDFCGEGAAAVVESLGGPLHQVTIDDIFSQVCKPSDEEGQTEECETVPDINLNDGMCNMSWGAIPYL
eukprot:jgi/Mesvir1/6134/Mv00838-RA.1